jgi:hypothetical protein
MSMMHPCFDPETTVTERLALIRGNMVKLFHRFEAPDAPIFDLRDECLKLLRSVGLLKSRRYSSRHVGVHPKNRYGDGLIIAHVGKLVIKFSVRGFSIEELGVPRATEMPPAGHWRHEEFTNFCNETVTKSDGVLPKFDPNEIEILSAQKSHTSQSCRCVLKGAPCDDDRVATNGVYSMDKIRGLRPSYAQVIDDGMLWEVVPWEVEDAFPLIMDLVQEAGNAAGTSVQHETRLEVCLKMVASYKRQSKGADLTDIESAVIWKKVVEETQSNDHEFNDELPDLAEFLKHTKYDMLGKLVDYQKSLKFVPRTVPASVMTAVMKLALGEDGRGHQTFKLDLSFYNIL